MQIFNPSIKKNFNFDFSACPLNYTKNFSRPQFSIFLFRILSKLQKLLSPLMKGKINFVFDVIVHNQSSSAPLGTIPRDPCTYSIESAALCSVGRSSSLSSR